jgi:hypothetical protein
MLFEALRDEEQSGDGQARKLADTIDELRSSLVLRECQRLRNSGPFEHTRVVRCLAKDVGDRAAG